MENKKASASPAPVADEKEQVASVTPEPTQAFKVTLDHCTFPRIDEITVIKESGKSVWIESPIDGGSRRFARESANHKIVFDRKEAAEYATASIKGLVDKKKAELADLEARLANYLKIASGKAAS